MRKPSIELLSEVLGYEVLSYNGVRHDFIKDGITYEAYPLNVYELMHLMKVWAAKQNFKVEHELSYGIERGRARLEQYQEFDMYDVFGYTIGRTSKSNWFNADTEHEAVTKACEWILKEIK